MVVFAINVVMSASCTSHTSPWDLYELAKPPPFSWAGQPGETRSLTFGGVPYRGRATSVFAVYADHSTFTGKEEVSQKYPGIVLLHGGGGHAFANKVLAHSLLRSLPCVDSAKTAVAPFRRFPFF